MTNLLASIVLGAALLKSPDLGAGKNSAGLTFWESVVCSDVAFDCGSLGVAAVLSLGMGVVESAAAAANEAGFWRGEIAAGLAAVGS